MAEQQNELYKFLSILGASDRTITVEDVNGAVYEVTTILPAGRQLAMMSAMEKAIESTSLRAAFDALQNASKDADGDQITITIRLVSMILEDKNSARIMKVLDALVLSAHPNLPKPASEHFELHEVLRMLLPFVSRLLRVMYIADQGKPVERVGKVGEA